MKIVTVAAPDPAPARTMYATLSTGIVGEPEITPLEGWIDRPEGS